MTSVTVDAPALASLKQATGLVEVRDPTGTVIGFFAPVSLEHADRYVEAAARTDPRELQRRLESTQKLHTTEEVLDRLQRLENP